MAQCILALDIGTSSTKALAITPSGQTFHSRIQGVPGASSGEQFYNSSLAALQACLRNNALSPVCLCLTGQVGSYFLYNSLLPPQQLFLHPWQTAQGKGFETILNSASPGYWQEQIGMQHPRLWSYPGPFITGLKNENNFSKISCEKLLSLKDYLYYRFTGLFASDPFTWRGLYNSQQKCFPKDYLAQLGIQENQLPFIESSFAAPGSLLPVVAQALGISPCPVVLGCNDVFAALLGTHCTSPGSAFDITGTSEHIGFLQNQPETNPLLISGPFFSGYANYGVTASSGSTLQWAQNNMGTIPSALPAHPLPLFLPYFCGERTPLYNPYASGTILGLRPNHTKADIATAAVCGVVYSLYSIWQLFPLKQRNSIANLHVTGGGTHIPLFNQVKADLFGLPLAISKEKEGSALGAAMIGAVWAGWFTSLAQVSQAWQKEIETVLPQKEMQAYHLEMAEKYRLLSHTVEPVFELI